jgi:diguanylate cyclase (GGDEF)-like protein/PAS domain S-box-containing protein
MKDQSRVNHELLDVNSALKQRVQELEHSESKRKRAEQAMAVIAEIGLVIGSTLHLDEVYERFAVETRRLIPIDSLTVNLYNFQENTMRVAYVYGLSIDGRGQGDPLVLEGSLSEAVIRSRTSISIQPASIDKIVERFPRLSPIFQAGLRSIMCVPLIYRDEVIGILHFRSKKQNAYTKQSLRLAERIGMQIAGAMVNAQLFSDLKKTEDSLRKSEGRFRGLVEKAAVGVAEIEMSTGRFFTVNSRLCDMMGRTEEEMLNTTFRAITHPEDIRLHEGKTALMLAGKIGHYSLEKRYLRKDGGIIWVNITVSPLWKPGETPGRNIVVVEDITERKRMEAEILALSITDQLTGLHNRRGFLSLAAQQLKLAVRNTSGTLLFFADLDGLKRINDTLGHEEGDRALIEAATVLKENFRASDIVARLGGDEYAALAVHINEANAKIITARLQSLITRRNRRKNRKYRLSISVGCSYYDPENPCTIDELMASADKLMYEHKQKKKSLLLQGVSLSSSKP